MDAQTEKPVVVSFVPVERAAEMLNKTAHCVRQLLSRNKLKKVLKGNNVFVDLDSVLSYHASKKGLRSWEAHIDTIRNQSFVSLRGACDVLLVQPNYAQRLVKDGHLDGYVTVSGDVMITKESINRYMRLDTNDTNQL